MWLTPEEIVRQFKMMKNDYKKVLKLVKQNQKDIESQSEQIKVTQEAIRRIDWKFNELNKNIELVNKSIDQIWEKIKKPR